MLGKQQENSACPLSKLAAKRRMAWQEREQQLLSIAEGIMQTEGFSGLTMDKLVAACSFSKGTVYNHFSSKEDLLCALCIKGMLKTLMLFKKANEFAGTSREKVLAINYAYRLHVLTDPTLFLCVLTSQTPAVREKASPERLREQQQLDKEMTAYCDNLFFLAVKQNDLKSSAAVNINQLVFAAWAMSFGTNVLLSMATEVEGVQRLDTGAAVLQNVNLLMDGMSWQPLSADFDYSLTWQRIGKEIFTDELAMLADRSLI